MFVPPPLAKPVAVAVAIVLVLVAPFLMRPREAVFSGDPDGKVVILTPHHQTICSAFSRAFAKHMKEKTGKNILVDWRVPGGTSEADKVIDSDFVAAFQQYWKNTLGRTWSDRVARSFNDRDLVLPEDSAAPFTLEQEAKRTFLESPVGIGVDLFFGGGSYDFTVQSQKGYIVARAGEMGQFGPAAVIDAHPDWFGDDVIPMAVSGELYRDEEDRWIGTCLSSFGIVYNTDVLRRLGITEPPTAWDDLGKTEFVHNIAMADPTQSGSVAKAFEMLIQQKIQAAVAEATPIPGLSGIRVHELALNEGWAAGLQLIQRIGANTRYFTDDATKIPRDVASGGAAAGMCIDFYGRATAEMVRDKDGRSRVGFVTPRGGSSWSVDPIAMFRGAPNPEYATAFIEFVLSHEGQKLWDFRAGVPGGPSGQSLRRLPIRKDLYTEELLPLFADPDVLPYESASDFTYQPEHTTGLFDTIRFVVRVMCIDTHDELQTAWETLIRTGFPRHATAMFHDVNLVNYQAAQSRIAEILKSDDKILEVRLARDLADLFRRQYATTVEMAERGE
ncbi:hypothetical protein BH23VER1_BH23VER1_28910 [soil metagenome]